MSCSIYGNNIAKPSYAQSRFSLMGGGALKIPHIINDEKTFIFVNYFGSRARNPFDSLSTVPTALERTGDFSQSVARSAVQIYDPLTNQPFANNVVPLSRIDPAAIGMLSLFPLPNQPGLVQNYQIIGSVPQNSDNFSVRANRSLTKKDRVSGSYSLQRRSGQNLQLFGFRDTSSGNGTSADVTWTRNIMTGLISNFRVNFSRNTNLMTPYFADGTDWARQLGIQGTSTDPRNYGPPNVSFTNFGGLTDGAPSRSANQTMGVGESIMRVKGRHTASFGFDYRRMQFNSITDQNARGTYAFSGLSTSAFDSAGSPINGTGFDFADFLLGRPQSSSIRYGSSDLYLRSSSYSAYVQDDWRIRPNLTVNVGLRYEYLTPLHEKYGRMANLDIAPGFTGVAVVTPSTPGPYTGAFPDGLVDPDKNNFAPRAAISYRPWKDRNLIIRTGYGMYYNGSVYNSAANRLSQQPPFAKTFSVNTSLANPLLIETGFIAVPAKSITNSFAISRSYLVGYAQSWNLSVQQTLPGQIVLEMGYLGTKGTRLDIQRLPNRATPGSPLTSEQRRLIGNATGFTYDTSDGNSIYHAAQLRVMRRFRNGFSANALYTFAKSIDNASSIGGGGAVVVQDDHNLAAERGLSSFNRQHVLSMNGMFSTSNRRGRGGQFGNVFLKDWTLSFGLTAQSGSPFTAMVLGNVSDAGGSGAVGSARADATGLAIDSGAGFFNPLAFAVPPSTRFGNAGRNTIIGPAMLSMNGSFGRTITFGDGRKNVDIRAESSNLMNNVNITRIGTTVNNSSFGLPLAASGMRSVTLNLRYRF